MRGRMTTLDLTLFAVFAAGLVYCAVDVVVGPSGRAQWSELRAEIRGVEGDIARLQTEKAALERKADALTGPEIDAELLDERLRAVFGVGRADERLLIEIE